MITKNKKRSFLLISIFCLILIIFSLTSCTNEMYQKRMLEYYSEDSNFVELTGIVKEKNQNNTLTVEVLTKSAEFELYNMEVGDFMLYTNVEILDNIELEDEIAFTSAPRQFYDGHKWPIVALSKGGQKLLSFEEGKENYINWIKNDFK